MAKPKRISEVVPEGIFPNAERVELPDAMNKNIEIVGVEIMNGEYGEYVVFAYHYPDKEKMFSTACGGKVVIKKLIYCQKEGLLPVIGKIVKIKDYYEIK